MSNYFTDLFMKYQLNSDKTVHAVCFYGGEFKYFLTLLRYVRRFLYNYLRFYFCKFEFEWTWTAFQGWLILNLTCNPVIWESAIKFYLHIYFTQIRVKRKKSFSWLSSLYFPFFLLTNIRLDALVGTSLRIHLCSKLNYFREYLCTTELEVF